MCMCECLSKRYLLPGSSYCLPLGDMDVKIRFRRQGVCGGGGGVPWRW